MPPTTSIRNRPGWQIVRLLKSRGLRQFDIAERAGVGQATVSRVIHHQVREGDVVERVWKAIEEGLAA